MTQGEIRAQLERVLAAEPFAHAGRLSRLLRYLVERTLAGEGDQLKEYVLGVEVFDRSDAYDPRLDSIVRVEARRLRSKLEEYYQGPGTADPVVITIPRGNYAPVFSPAAPATTSPASPATSATPVTPAARTPVPWFATAAVIAGAITLILIVALRSRPGVTPAAQASSSPSIAVLPFQHFSTNEADAMLAAQITDAVTAELARLGTVSVASRTTASQYTSEPRPLREIARTLGVHYVMESSAVATSHGVHIQARVVDGVSDRKVWVGEYDGRLDQVEELSRRIAQEAASALQKISRQQ